MSNREKREARAGLVRTGYERFLTENGKPAARPSKERLALDKAFPGCGVRLCAWADRQSEPREAIASLLAVLRLGGHEAVMDCFRGRSDRTPEERVILACLKEANPRNRLYGRTADGRVVSDVRCVVDGVSYDVKLDEASK